MLGGISPNRHVQNFVLLVRYMKKRPNKETYIDKNTANLYRIRTLKINSKKNFVKHLFVNITEVRL